MHNIYLDIKYAIMKLLHPKLKVLFVCSKYYIHEQKSSIYFLTINKFPFSIFPLYRGKYNNPFTTIEKRGWAIDEEIDIRCTAVIRNNGLSHLKASEKNNLLNCYRSISYVYCSFWPSRNENASRENVLPLKVS